MKKILALLTVLVLILSLSACKKSKTTSDSSSDATLQTSESENSDTQSSEDSNIYTDEDSKSSTTEPANNQKPNQGTTSKAQTSNNKPQTGNNGGNSGTGKNENKNSTTGNNNQAKDNEKTLKLDSQYLFYEKINDDYVMMYDVHFNDNGVLALWGYKHRIAKKDTSDAEMVKIFNENMTPNKAVGFTQYCYNSNGDGEVHGATMVFYDFEPAHAIDDKKVSSFQYPDLFNSKYADWVLKYKDAVLLPNYVIKHNSSQATDDFCYEYKLAKYTYDAKSKTVTITGSIPLTSFSLVDDTHFLYTINGKQHKGEAGYGWQEKLNYFVSNN